MKLTKELQERIDDYLDNISPEELYNTAVKEFGFEDKPVDVFIQLHEEPDVIEYSEYLQEITVSKKFMKDNRDLSKTTNKMSLLEWLANVEDATEDWAKEYIESCGSQTHHAGDCTRAPITCGLCALEEILEEYREYFLKNEFI